MRWRVAAIVAMAALGCGRDRSRQGTPSASATTPPVPCTVRSAEKLGFPFLRVCPPGEPGFWINAAPMGCSGGEHDTVPCPPVTAIAHAVSKDHAPIASSIAALTDKETAARVCFMRMGGHLASRAERSKAQHAMGLASVLVTESSVAANRFRFEELPEWVVEESGEECATGLPAATCHFGWFPSTSRGTALNWENLRECNARYAPGPGTGPMPYISIGGGCSAATWSWPADGGTSALPCQLRSPATDERGAPVAAVFSIACTAPQPRAHPATPDKDLAAYRCVLPESALGTFDLPGR